MDLAQVRSRVIGIAHGFRRTPDHTVVIDVWFNRSDSTQVHLMEGIISKLQDENQPYPPQHLIHQAQNLTWGLPLNLHHLIIWSPGPSFEKLVACHDPLLAEVTNDFEVLYFNPDLLTPKISNLFNITLEPERLMKGWYLDPTETGKALKGGDFRAWESLQPTIGIMELGESTDFARKTGIMHVQIEGRWLPSTEAGVKTFTWYQDYLSGHPGSFLLKGGSWYKIEGYEVKRDSRISRVVIEPNDLNEYVEVHLSKLSIPLR